MGNRHIPVATVDAVLDARAAGLAVKEIARRSGVSVTTVYRLTKDAPVDRRAGANRLRAETPPPWWPKAKALIDAGFSRNDTAVTLGVSKSAVYRAASKFG